MSGTVYVLCIVSLDTIQLRSKSIQYILYKYILVKT